MLFCSIACIILLASWSTNRESGPSKSTLQFVLIRKLLRLVLVSPMMSQIQASRLLDKSVWKKPACKYSFYTFRSLCCSWYNAWFHLFIPSVSIITFCTRWRDCGARECNTWHAEKCRCLWYMLEKSHWLLTCIVQTWSHLLHSQTLVQPHKYRGPDLHSFLFILPSFRPPFMYLLSTRFISTFLEYRYQLWHIQTRSLQLLLSALHFPSPKTSISPFSLCILSFTLDLHIYSQSLL